MGTLSEWSVISRPIFEQQPYVMPIFYLFTLTTTFGVMNVVIGVMVEHALDAAKCYSELQQERTKRQQMRSVVEIKKIMEEGDTNKSGTLHLAELRRAFATHPAAKELLTKIE